MRKIVLATILAALLSVLLSSHTLAQTTNATLGGTVVDATGALIPGVGLTATNIQTGVAVSAVSNEAGTYQFPGLQTGTYRVSAELPGFQTQVYNSVVLGLAQQVRLNFTLQVGATTQAVEVTATVDTLLATSSSSVGSVLPEYRVRDLPLASRNITDLVSTAGGVEGSNFAGGRVGQVNTTRDGLSVVDPRYANGVYSVVNMSPDLVEEVRVIVGKIDSSTARGVGQFQTVTRSGTNRFRGSVFTSNRNSALAANSWFNNFNGVKKDYLNQNQFGARLGGPIVRNKTFFFFLYEGTRTVQKTVVTSPVLTETARRGIFRYFPGVPGGNAIAHDPTVNLAGVPVTPPGATGPLQSFSVFNYDPLRPGFDPTGLIQKAIANLPPANDFTTGDGLNTAGHLWVRRSIGTEGNRGNGVDINRNQWNLRLDHVFNPRHKLSLVATIERTWADSDLAPLPGGFSGGANRIPRAHSLSFSSVLSPTLVNEARVGLTKQNTEQPGSWDDPRHGADIRAIMPYSNGIPYVVTPTLFSAVTYGTGPSRGNKSPSWIYADTLNWTKQQHAFKIGVEWRKGTTAGFDSGGARPGVRLGTGGVTGIPVTGIDNTTIPGLAAQDQETARTLLTDLAGSLASMSERFTLCCDPKVLHYKDFREWWRKYRIHTETEFSTFFQDDWKLRPSLTLNFGVAYAWFGSPYGPDGYMVQPVGGGDALPKGAFIVPEPVGKHSAQPDKQLIDNDWNNIAPTLGLSWSIPYWGKDKTVLRLGYGWTYVGRMSSGQGLDFSQEIGASPGVNQVVTDSTSNVYRDLRNVVLPLPGRYPDGAIATIPYTERSQGVSSWDPHARIPYIQNWNIEIQRELAANLTLELRYLGNKGTKLYGGVPVNDVNIFENGILDAFNATRSGGNAPLFDRILRGLDLGLGPVNGTTVTGSASLRRNTTTRSMIANGNVGALADFLSTNDTGGQRGNLLRNGGLPENFIVTSPQFVVGNGIYHTTPSNSTYHSMQAQVTKRLSQGFTSTTTYTWGRALGENDTDGEVVYLNPRDRSRNKSLLGFHRTHSLRSNGTFELPFGPGRNFLNNAPSWVSRLVERWQVGTIFSVTSGAPLTITAPVSTFTQRTIGPPDIVGEFPRSMGNVAFVDNGVIYFEGLRQVQDDAARAGVTTAQSTQGAFSNRAITDSDGRYLLVNPQPGALGNMGLRWIEGPGRITLDLNLIKRVKIGETKEVEVRADAINALNTPNFGNPNVNINSSNFGRITAATGSRAFTLSARVNF